jgi:hypothetical protein
VEVVVEHKNQRDQDQQVEQVVVEPADLEQRQQEQLTQVEVEPVEGAALELRAVPLS